MYRSIEMSLAQRAAAANQSVGRKLFSPAGLQILYRKHGVRFKRVRLRKCARPGSDSARNREPLLWELKRTVMALSGQGYDTVFVDEAIYSWRGYC